MILLPATFDRLGPAKAQVLRWLGAACRRPGCDLSVIALIRFCVRGEAQLVLVLDGDRPVAAGVTQVRRHGDGRLSAWVLTLGGTGTGSWRPVIDAIEAGARATGCASLEFVGRRAWRRLFPDFDAVPDPVGYHFTKALR